MAEAMLGKYNRTSSCEVLASSPKKRKENTMGDHSKHIENKHSPSHPIGSSDKNTEKRRSVVIQIPPKRQRMPGNYSSTDIIQALNTAMSTEERTEALENAIATFDHNDRNLHDDEIGAGADIALVKTLIFLQFRVGFRGEPMKTNMEAITKEVGFALECLECIYRASSDAVGKSFARVGNDLLQILVVLIGNEIKNRQKSISSFSADDSESSDPGGNGHRSTPVNNKRAEEGNRAASPPQTGLIYMHDSMLRKATKIIGHFARVGRNTRPMARFPGFLKSILDLCNLRPFSTIPFEARLSSLWAVANLACNTDNMPMMIHTPKLMDSLITISNRHPTSGDTLETTMEILRAKSIASRTILNLSWSPENKNLMSESIPLVQALCSLALERHAPYKNSKTMQNILLQTRQHSLSSLRNISAVPHQRKVSLCTYKGGKLLDVLTDVMLNETDGAVLDYAFSAIDNLTIPDTAQYIVDRPALVLALKNVLFENTSDTTEGNDNSVKCQCASATILVLERAITPDKACYENFRELLDTINPSNSTDCSDESGSLNATAL